MTTMTAKKIVCVSKYTRFDPSNPSKTRPEDFVLVTPSEDGCLSSYFTGEGYIQVGEAEVTIKISSAEDNTRNAVVALTKQKESILAKAQMAATEIEQKIQSLLAITNQA